MSNKQLTITASILAKTDKREFVKQALLKLIPPTLEEEGCLNYDLHQDNENPDLFFFYENWASYDLWQKHLNSPHIKANQTATEGAIESVTIGQLSPVE